MWKVVGRHLFLNIIPSNATAETGWEIVGVIGAWDLVSGEVFGYKNWLRLRCFQDELVPCWPLSVFLCWFDVYDLDSCKMVGTFPEFLKFDRLLPKLKWFTCNSHSVRAVHWGESLVTDEPVEFEKYLKRLEVQDFSRTTDYFRGILQNNLHFNQEILKDVNI